MQLFSVGLDARGVYHQEEFIVVQAIQYYVIDSAALFIKQEVIAAGARSLVLDRSGQGVIQTLPGLRSANAELSHMADIEQCCRRSSMQVFRQDSCRVLQRHIPARERHHFGF